MIDLPADQGIPQLFVGWEFLQTFVVRMDFQRNELTFIDLVHFVKRQGAAVPLILKKHGNGIYLDARVDGIPGRFQLDSGNEIGLFLNSAFVQQYHLRTKLHATLRGWNGNGMGGDSPERGSRASTASTWPASFYASRWSDYKRATITTYRSSRGASAKAH